MNQHYKTQKHLNNVNSVGLYVCSNCNKEYKYETGLLKHYKECALLEQNNNNINTNEHIKEKYELKLENEKIKFENEKIKIAQERIKETYEFKLKINELENEKLKLELKLQSNNINIANSNSNNITNTNNTNNTTNNTTNVKLSKIDNLNINFHNVIDIETFINNYENEYGLTNKQTETLLYNQENGGIHSCIASLVHYIKDSMLQQYKEKGMDINQKDVIFPFLLSDKCLRDHFEKNINGNWDKTTSIENIAKIINITERQIFKHHNKYMQLSNAEKKKLVNGILKSSSYAKLSNISDPTLYNKKDEPKNAITEPLTNTSDPEPLTNMTETESTTTTESKPLETEPITTTETKPLTNEVESKQPKVSSKYQEILDML